MSGWTNFRAGPQRLNRRGFHTSSSASAKAPAPAPEDQARQIRLRLQELGPEYSCLGLYLASRIDILPPEYCRELANTTDSAPPIHPSTVRHLMLQELGGHAERAFVEFDDVPEKTTLTAQQHRALLRTGVPVAVVLINPHFYELRNDQGTGVWNRPELNDLFLDLLTPDVLADFAAALRRKASGRVAREGMELLDGDAASSDLLKLYRPYPELSTDRVLTFQLADPRPDPIAHHQTQAPDVLATRLCHAWVRQALHGHCFPVDPQLHTTYIDDENRIAFLNCDVVGLTESARRNLTHYFDAILVDDPDQAAIHLLREMVPARPGMTVDADGFRSSFRQAGYFGALAPILGTDSNALAQLVFQHWKTALDHGYLPKPHLLCFYRGLFSMVRVARHVSTAGDPLRKAVEELRMALVFEQLREVVNFRYWFQSSDKLAAAMINLPRTFDDALTRASAIKDSVPHQERRSSVSPRPASAAFANLIVLLVLVVVTTRLPGVDAWWGKLLPLALMLAGLLAVRQVFD